MNKKILIRVFFYSGSAFILGFCLHRLWSLYVTPSSMEWKAERKIISAEKESLLFLGDIMLGRHVETLIKKYGSSYPFEAIDDELHSHITIANLEGPIPETHVQTPLQGFQFSFPSTTPSLLKAHGIQAVSLANNHSMDWGQGGYMHTRKVLDDALVAHFGAYSSTADDYFETQVGTSSIIIFGINMITDTWDRGKALAVAKKIRAEHLSSNVVAYLHWGEEYSHTQSDRQRVLAHQLIDTGVDIVIGSHPHVVQGVETYKGGIIFYSLGNFIFDQYFSDETQESYMLSLAIDGGGKIFTIIPLASDRSQIHVATGTVRGSILQTIAGNSSKELREGILKDGTINIEHK